jgi:hypothetical protein
MASVCFRRYLNFSRGLLSSWRPRGARPGSWSRGALCYRPACRSSSCRSPPLRRPSPVDSRPSAACTIPTAAHNAETTRRAREVRPQRLDDPVRSSPRSLMEPTICLEAPVRIFLDHAPRLAHKAGSAAIWVFSILPAWSVGSRLDVTLDYEANYLPASLAGVAGNGRWPARSAARS